MLGKVCERFVEKSPLSVMVRGMLERVLGADQLHAWYARTAQTPSTRTRLFSTVSALRSHGVCCIQPAVHAASRHHEDTIGTARVSVSNTRNGVETQTSAALVRYRATAVAPLMAPRGGACAPWVPGCRVNRVDGHGREATERRRTVLRDTHAGALPGTSLVVYEPAQGLVTDGFPCEDGPAQERALCGALRETVHAGDLWSADRNVCTCALLCDIDRRGACFLIRQHEGLPYALVSFLHAPGRVETGHVAEQRVRGWDAQGDAHVCRRIRVTRDQATRDGRKRLSIVTHCPRQKASATRVARVDRTRWTLETAFQPLAASVHAAIKTLGSPRAAFCGLCLALVASHMLAVVLAA